MVATIVTIWPGRDAHAINDGVLADVCDYPAVVRLDNPGRGGYAPDSCTGIYIGGRVVLTAAHCFDGAGYRVDGQLIYELTGVTPASALCQDDSDCPEVQIMGAFQPLECNEPLGFCEFADPGISNGFARAEFGEAYDPWGVEHPGVSVPISYCRIKPTFLDNPDDTNEDFAYCILSEAPDV